MERITISVPDDLMKKLKSQSDINWPEVAKEGIQKKLELLERLKAKGVL